MRWQLCPGPALTPQDWLPEDTAVGKVDPVLQLPPGRALIRVLLENGESQRFHWVKSSEEKKDFIFCCN